MGKGYIEMLTSFQINDQVITFKEWSVIKTCLKEYYIFLCQFEKI